ncbi:P-selectin [Genypterus blacodes]|uniref:P-selectin n=1 Tax=Genypterus blacodes TaxID=154954 RepID=UPI003F75777B
MVWSECSDKNERLNRERMMYQVSVQSLYPRLLIVALVVFARELSSGGGAHAWTYDYSVTPNRNWVVARQWCRKHFTDMVAIQNQEEGDYLNKMLPYNANYYWIGLRKVAGEWTWVGTNKTLARGTENWAVGEPNNFQDQQTCVEIYIQREHDNGKWNDERCRSKKGTICYTASCSQHSCSPHADCVETIGNHTCQCHPGFRGPHCEAIECKPLSDPVKGSHHCSHPNGLYRFNSSCHFQCGLGHGLVGAPTLQCQASGLWDRAAPLCQAEQCPAIDHAPAGGSVNCSLIQPPFSPNSSCEFRCDEGYELIGQDRIGCEHGGQWSASIPSCTVKRCPPVLGPLSGNVTCVDAVEPLSFGSVCKFSCWEGYNLTGHNTLACLASGQWSKASPTCAAVQCDGLKPPSNATMQCYDPAERYSYGSICTVQCEEGFDLIGTKRIKCSSEGNWSDELPVCRAKSCSPILSPLHGSMSCFNPSEGNASFGSKCRSACDEGFLLDGVADTACSSVGDWSAAVPRCLAKRCPTLNSTPHGVLSCSQPHGEFSFGSRCKSTCEEGFVPSEADDVECTSLGTWSRELPLCLAHPCPLLATAPQDGRRNCSQPHSYVGQGSRCDFICNQGFLLKGEQTMTCNRSGHWDHDQPTCQAAGMDLGTAMLVYAGVGAASGLLLVALLGLLLLITKQFKKEGMVISDTSAWGERDNPAFEP